MKRIPSLLGSVLLVAMLQSCSSDHGVARLTQPRARGSVDLGLAAPIPSGETITFFVAFGASGEPSATWTASGVFTDVGTVTYDQVQFEAIPSPVTGTEHVETTMIGAVGTFRMRFDKDIGLGIPGRWVILEGASGYARLHGEGSWRSTTTSPSTSTISAVGTVHFD